MKAHTTQTLFRPALSLAAMVMASSMAMAGESAPAPAPAPEPESPDYVSGVLTFAANTHFISYGQDIWGAGSEWEDLLFNPSLELTFKLGGGWSAILGTWWDVNDNAESSIGDAIQEVDVWAGFAYATGDWTFTLLYQEWMYASQSERIVDFKIAYAGFYGLNPSLLLHGRVDGAEPFDTGLVTVLGISPGTKLGPVAISFPISVAADTDGFHGGDAGFSFVSAGISGSLPLGAGWTLGAGVTFYHTEDAVIVTNPDSDFLTGTVSVALAF